MVLYVADVGQGTAIVIEVQEIQVQNGASLILLMSYYIAGNFCKVQIFTIFATHDQNVKIRT